MMGLRKYFDEEIKPLAGQLTLALRELVLEEDTVFKLAVCDCGCCRVDLADEMIQDDADHYFASVRCQKTWEARQ